MSLLARKPVRIGRAQREARDDRVFLVATEDTHAPAQYFAELAFPRVKVFWSDRNCNHDRQTTRHYVDGGL